MPQLDLFAPAAKDEPADKAQVQQRREPLGVEAAEAVNETEAQPQEAPGKASINVDAIAEKKDSYHLQVPRGNDVIFSDQNISVKIKQKKIKEIIEEVVQVKPAKLPQKRGRKPLKDVEGENDPIEVPDDEELFKKQYYPISVVAQWFKVNTSLLRFWENEFDILKPRKNRKGDRLFRPEDVKNLELIHHLLRQRKYSIEGAKEFLKGDKEKADIQLRVTKSLLKFRSFLLELKANL